MYIKLENKRPIKSRDLKWKEEHARFSPSGASSWLECPGFAFLEPNPPSKASLTGRQRHKEEEENLKAYLLLDEKPQSPYVKYIDSILPDDCDIYIEERFKSIEFPEFFGTPDVVIYNQKESSLNIIDFKTGLYKVNPKYNLQMACYHYLFCSSIGIARPDEMIFTIFQQQPQSSQYEVTCWKVVRPWIHSFIQEELKPFLAQYTKETKLKYSLLKKNPGCNTCFKLNKCPMYGNDMKNQLETVSSKGSMTLSNIPEPAFIELWKMGQDIRKYLKNLDKEVERRATDGSLTLLEKEKMREVRIWKNKDEALKDARFTQETLIPVSEASKVMSGPEKEKYISKRTDTKWVLSNNTKEIE